MWPKRFSTGPSGRTLHYYRLIVNTGTFAAITVQPRKILLQQAAGGTPLASPELSDCKFESFSLIVQGPPTAETPAVLALD